MIKLIFIIITALGLSYILLSSNSVASNTKKEEVKLTDNTVEISAGDWKHLYFFGLTKHPISEVGLNQQMAQGLIRMVKVQSSISTGALIDPKYMFNAKGLTPWLAMHTVLHLKQPSLLTDVAKGSGSAHVPNTFLEDIFKNHNNWPKALLDEHDIELQGFNVFILPFIVHKNTKYDLTFHQSMKAPDGSLEIFGVSEFDEKHPEKVLSIIQGEIEFIKEKRPDVFGH
ncbi:hypothetical protein OQJ46_00860 [Microbulbifer thermotolerans]|nr:hypothetical protein [Microbulbifer thermotolerans]MCX2781537.1 hypothetical protein [Microbulbifer thermotolerans]MCX2794694.1 hypothetical protein [Microbulbifer thermotolerans]